MKETGKNDDSSNTRRSFLKKMGIGIGAASLAGVSGVSLLKSEGSR
jgi:hypothetical protein